jgi:hypothetical protein
MWWCLCFPRSHPHATSDDADVYAFGGFTPTTYPHKLRWGLPGEPAGLSLRIAGGPAMVQHQSSGWLLALMVLPRLEQASFEWPVFAN